MLILNEAVRYIVQIVSLTEISKRYRKYEHIGFNFDESIPILFSKYTIVLDISPSVLIETSPHVFPKLYESQNI